MKTVRDVLDEERRADTRPLIREDLVTLRRQVDVLAARYKGKVVHFGEERATTSFSTLAYAESFKMAASRRFRANRVGGEVRLHWRRE